MLLAGHPVGQRLDRSFLARDPFSDLPPGGAACGRGEVAATLLGPVGFLHAVPQSALDGKEILGSLHHHLHVSESSGQGWWPWPPEGPGTNHDAPPGLEEGGAGDHGLRVVTSTLLIGHATIPSPTAFLCQRFRSKICELFQRSRRSPTS